jgi:hypothetical protein
LLEKAPHAGIGQKALEPVRVRARGLVQTQELASFPAGLGQPLVRFQNGHVFRDFGFDMEPIMNAAPRRFPVRNCFRSNGVARPLTFQNNDTLARENGFFERVRLRRQIALIVWHRKKPFGLIHKG